MWKHSRACLVSWWIPAKTKTTLELRRWLLKNKTKQTKQQTIQNKNKTNKQQTKGASMLVFLGVWPKDVIVAIEKKKIATEIFLDGKECRSDRSS